jgi:hypothetical protein
MNWKTKIMIIDSNEEHTQFNSRILVAMYFFNKHQYVSPPLDYIINNLPKFLWDVVKEDQRIINKLKNDYGL